MLSRRSSASFVLLCLLASCGTDNQPTAPRESLEAPFNAGELTGSTLGPVGAFVTTSGPGALITGIPGQFTSLRYQGTGGVSTTPFIYFAMSFPLGASNSDIWRIGLNGKGIQRITSDTQPQRYPSISRDGRQIVYFQTIAELGHSPLQDIIRIQANGSGRTRIGTSIDSRNPVAWTPQSDSFYFFQNDPFSFGLWRQANQQSQAELLTDQIESGPSLGTINGVPVLIYSYRKRLMRMNLLTRDTTVFLAVSGATLTDPKLSPDGQQVLFTQQDSLVAVAAPFQIRVAAVANPAISKRLATIPVEGLYSLPTASWAPDSRHVVATLQVEPEPYAQLFDLDANAIPDALGVPRRLITTLTGTLFPGVSVGPAPSVQGRPLIGPGAPLGETASGIVFGQRAGGALASVVAFGGAEADSVELIAQTGLNSTAPVLSISLWADQLTSLGFVNDPAGPVTTVVDSTLGATGALITFDATDGSVALVLPFALAPGEAAPTVRDEGSARVFRGRFLTVVGSDGVARGASREVVLDHASGKIRAN